MRSGCLLFADELAAGSVTVEQLAASRRLRLAFGGLGLGRRPVAGLGRVLVKLGLLEGRRAMVATLRAIRRELGLPVGGGAPRLLLRVDEFPCALALDTPRYDLDAFRRFHETLSGAGVGYLLAVTPNISRDFLNPNGGGSRPMLPSEVEFLTDAAASGSIEVGLHGLTHRTRHLNPKRRSELTGLSPAETRSLVDRGLAEVKEATGLVPRVFVAPYNTFDPGQLRVLGERFPVVTGGPESVRLLGFHPAPLWYSGMVYLPSYPPLYGRPQEIAAALESFADVGGRPWVPAVLHWEDDLDDGFRSLQGAAARLGAHPGSWAELIGLAEGLRDGDATR